MAKTVSNSRLRNLNGFNKKKLLWLKAETCKKIVKEYGTPVIVYDESTLTALAKELLNLPHAYGLTPRYAVKANINSSLITFFDQHGLHFDASSHWEVERLLRYGISGSKILLTAQQKAPNPLALLKKGVLLNATSLHQFQIYAAAVQQQKQKNSKLSHSLSVRLNPGVSSSVAYKTNVAGLDSSFGIWHESIPTLLEYAKHYGVKIERLHVHLSSNTDPIEWLHLIENVLRKLVPQLADVSIFNVGGGFAVARYPGEAQTNLMRVFRELKQLILDFGKVSGRQLQLELEPGAYLTAPSGILIGKIDDITRTSSKVSTPAQKKELKEKVFVKLDTGMNDLMRPALYGAEHYMAVVQNPLSKQKLAKLTLPAVKSKTPVIIVGHCCEKGDLLTPVSHNPHEAQERILGKLAVGDYVMIASVGAYGQSLANHYNSFPNLAECWLDSHQKLHLIRKRETLSDLIRSEINIFNK